MIEDPRVRGCAGVMRLIDDDQIEGVAGESLEPPRQRLDGAHLYGLRWIRSRIVSANDRTRDAELQQAAMALVEQLAAVREEQNAAAAGNGGSYALGSDGGFAGAG